ncbi:MAG: AAC(3) family N-acetyltransferase [Kofleriaceae bacterium]|nr:AAC(3) family N-acetyltransferase [Kofleriaceae bacterium]MBP9165859.1 AAC(3) family N-acetyltransferase [Kofleriaceae bacterium]MBP9862859.1 AAC(3) family N-acetyltransferase [Kofleriaceae bacterium]
MTTPSTQASLANQLRSLGVRPGLALMVHSSLRRVGAIEGGAEAMLEALLEVLRPHGTLMMVLGADLTVPFEAKSTPVDIEEMGVLVEVFRRHAQTQVNDHAASRWGAIGPESHALLEPIPLHDYYGPGSVLQRFTDGGGKVLRLGANEDTVTLTHWAEYLARIPDKRRVSLRYVRADVGEQWIDSLDDTDGIRAWAEGDYFPKVWLDFLASGRARTGPVGNVIAELFDAQEFVAFAVDWMEHRL